MLSFDRAYRKLQLAHSRRFRRYTVVGIAVLLTLLPALGAEQTSAAYRQAVLAIQQTIQASDLDKARTLLDSALKTYPSDGGLENLLGIIEIEQAHVEPARQAFTRAIQHSPRLVGAYLNLARIVMQTAQFNPAQRTYALHLLNTALRLEPENTEALYQGAVLEMWSQNYAGSRARLSQISVDARQKPQVQDLLYADTMVLGTQAEANHAVELLVANPDVTEDEALLLLPALQAARRADGIDALLTGINLRQPLSANGLRVLGLAQEAEGKSNEARTTLENAFALDTSRDAPLIDLARISLAKEDYQGALSYLAHARALEPRDAGLAYEFGWVCLKMNLISEARKALGEAVGLAPENPDYNLALGTMEAYPQGIPYLTKFHTLRPADPAGTLALGAAYFQGNDFDLAAKWLNEAVNAPSTAAMAHYFLGKVFSQQGHYDEAISQLLLSDSLKPDQPDVLAELGQAYMQAGKYPEAGQRLGHAVALDPNNYSANFALLRLYAHTGDPRREEQSKRFGAIRNSNEEQYREAMRVLETRPDTEAITTPQ